VDIDGDGDMDFAITGSDGTAKVTWVENTAGDATAWTENTVASGLNARVIHGLDMDQDGDNDLLLTDATSNDTLWYENTAGDGTAWTSHTIAISSNHDYNLNFADIDGDGDFDVLGGLKDGANWYENTAGDGSAWSTHVIDNSLSGAIGVTGARVNSADVDSDGDLDVLWGNVGQAVWFENTAGDGSAWTTNSFDTNSSKAQIWSVIAADFDGDGDMDTAVTAGSLGSSGSGGVWWFNNKGGQFSLATTDTAPQTLNNNDTDDILKITATHHGISGDNDLELVTFDLLFEEAASDPLTSAEANAIVANLKIYKDTGSGTFESGTDTLVTTVSTLSLTSGVQTVTFADGDANVQIAAGASSTYFVAVELTSNAELQTPHKFQITHKTQATSTAQDRTNDFPLTLSFVKNATSSNTSASSTSPFPNVNTGFTVIEGATATIAQAT